MDQVKIGRFIAQLRKEQGLTQSQLAEKLNISNRTVSKWETGSGMPDVSLLTPLCEILSITVDELFMGERAPLENTVNDTVSEEPPIKKSVPVKRIILIILAIVLVIALCALTTCHFFKKQNTHSPSATGTPVLTKTPSLTGTPLLTGTPTATLTVSPSPTATATPMPTPMQTQSPNVLPDMPYGGYKFTSIEGKQSQWSYYYINCGMDTSPLSRYSSYTGTLTLSYEVFNPTADTISVYFHVQTIHNNWWCYLAEEGFRDFKNIPPYSKETVTVEFPVENGNIDFSANDGTTVSVNAEKTFLRFDIKFPDLTKAGNTVYILANSADDPILSGDWYSTGYMTPEFVN